MSYIPAYFVIQSSNSPYEIEKNHCYFALFLFIAHNICDNGIVRSRFACQKSSFISKITLFVTQKNQIEARKRHSFSCVVGGAQIYFKRKKLNK